MLISADIADSSAVTYAVAEVRHMWGRIDGIVHGAGMLADRAIADKTEDQARMVIDAKMAGPTPLASTRPRKTRCARSFSSLPLPVATAIWVKWITRWPMPVSSPWHILKLNAGGVSVSFGDRLGRVGWRHGQR